MWASVPAGDPPGRRLPETGGKRAGTTEPAPGSGSAPPLTRTAIKDNGRHERIFCHRQLYRDGIPREAPHRSGFACFVGRPNAGKSTLTNALVGQKVAITSDQPQTTRHTVRGIVHRPDAQLVLVDTPGLHKPRTLLGERLNDVVAHDLAEVDVIGFCLPADREDRPRATGSSPSELAGVAKTPKIAVVTKTDLVDRSALAEQLLAVDQLGENWARVGRDRPGLARSPGDQVDLLADLLVAAAAGGRRRSTRTASSPTSPSRSWSPS